MKLKLVVIATLTLATLTNCTSSTYTPAGQPVQAIEGVYAHTKQAGENDPVVVDKKEFKMNDKAGKLLMQLEREKTKRIKIKADAQLKAAEEAAEAEKEKVAADLKARKAELRMAERLANPCSALNRLTLSAPAECFDQAPPMAVTVIGQPASFVPGPVLHIGGESNHRQHRR